LPEVFFTSKHVWRLGSAWTVGELTALSPHPIAALRGWDAGRNRRGKGGEEGKGEGRGRWGLREEKGDVN